uniref:PUM-HD domain-containing protein n=1 Tax=Heterorhabditis bacteriophora TaxID=37862 RepID=A0A1I7X7F4_HETBA
MAVNNPLPVDYVRNMGYGYGGGAGRPTYSSPIFYNPSPQLSDSGISSSNSKTNQSADEVISISPPCYDTVSAMTNSYMTPIAMRRSPLTRIDRNVSPSPFHSFYKGQQQSQLSCSFSNLRFNESIDGSVRSESRVATRTALPPWTMDNQGRVTLTLLQILDENLLETFAKDKTGCTHIQELYPQDGTIERVRLMKVLEKDGVFENLCSDVFGNFFIQRVIEMSSVSEQRWIATRLSENNKNEDNNMYSLCLNRYSCRVVQKAIEVCLALDLKGPLLQKLYRADLVNLAVDQNANHVIQKIMNSFSLPHWAFIVESFLQNPTSLFEVAENKYGCRVIQLSIEMLSDSSKVIYFIFHLFYVFIKILNFIV